MWGHASPSPMRSATPQAPNSSHGGREVIAHRRQGVCVVFERLRQLFGASSKVSEPAVVHGTTADQGKTSPTAAKSPAAEKKAAPPWKPMQAEFRDDERRAVLSVDGAAVHALSSTITSELLASIDKIPPFPVIANRLIEALESKNVRTDVIERLVTQDAVIAAKILSVANSPVYALSTPVETLPLAMRTLGLEEISRIAVAAAAAAVFDVGERLAHDSVSQHQQAVWAHSLATARGAAWLAMQRNADVQRAYVAGLIHDVGKAVALRGLGMAVVNGRLAERPTPALVSATIEHAHVEVGNIVADAWRLGDYLAAVVAHHHDLNDTDELTRIVMLTSMVDELRINPAQPQDLLAQIQALAGVMSVSSTLLAELEFELKKASSSAKL